MKNKLIDWLFQTMLLALGSTICAFAVKAIMIPQGFISGGLTGAALVLHYLHPATPVALLYVLINLPVFVLGWWVVGLRFLLYSLWGMLLYTLALSAISFRLELADPMLAALVAGGLSGLGVAIVLRSSGSTGGTELSDSYFQAISPLDSLYMGRERRENQWKSRSIIPSNFRSQRLQTKPMVKNGGLSSRWVAWLERISSPTLTSKPSAPWIHCT